MMEGQIHKSASLKDMQDPARKSNTKIKFNLDQGHLKCFMSEKSTLKSFQKKQDPENYSNLSAGEHLRTRPYTFSLRICSSQSRKGPQYRTHSLFNNKLLFIDDEDDFLSNNFYGTSDFKVQEESISQYLLNPNQQTQCQDARHEILQMQFNATVTNFNQNVDEKIAAECLRVITEQTDSTSNPSKDSYRTNSISNQYNTVSPYYYHNYPYYCQQQSPAYYNRLQDGSSQIPMIGDDLKPRNKKNTYQNQSQLFKVNLEIIQRDGRTTLMLRNIPNKYTRDMILEEINGFKDFKKKYDFFYLPIDYRNQCNVGYAFINLIHSKFIKEFYEKFHYKKWQKFNSEKICQICYARIQGTAQLLRHFKDSNILQQKDKRIRPLIDFKNTGLVQIVERQKNETITPSIDFS